MTQLPMESWDVKARRDLEPYDIQPVDARPGSSAPATEAHHIWRRSFTAGPCDWVELPDGTVLPNLVGLSQESHELIERGGHRIVCCPFGPNGSYLFYWLTATVLERIEFNGQNPYDVAPMYGQPLYPQPGPQGAVVGRTAVGTDATDHGAMQLTVDGDEVPHDDVCAGHEEEETCSKCKGRGRVRKQAKKETSNEPRPKVTWSVRVPKDEQENGHEVLESLVTAAVEQDVKRQELQSAKGGAYYVLVRALHSYITRGPE